VPVGQSLVTNYIAGNAHRVLRQGLDSLDGPLRRDRFYRSMDVLSFLQDTLIWFVPISCSLNICVVTSSDASIYLLLIVKHGGNRLHALVFVMWWLMVCSLPPALNTGRRMDHWT
jgi:hypothetical protein